MNETTDNTAAATAQQPTTEQIGITEEEGDFESTFDDLHDSAASNKKFRFSSERKKHSRRGGDSWHALSRM